MATNLNNRWIPYPAKEEKPIGEILSNFTKFNPEILIAAWQKLGMLDTIIDELERMGLVERPESEPFPGSFRSEGW